MSLKRHAWRKATALLSLLALTGGIVAGCAGPTAVREGEATGRYEVAVKLDPVTLNPPALGTLSFELTDRQTRKAVTQYEPVFDTQDLGHMVIVNKDLNFFYHSTTNHLVNGMASLPASFPEMGTYYAWTYFKPAGGELQELTTSVQTGAEPVRQPQEEDLQAKVVYGTMIELLRGDETIRAGEPAQLAFRVTQRGYPVRDLDAYYGAPGHLWIVQVPEVGAAEAEAQAEAQAEGTFPELGHELGSSQFYAQATPDATEEENQTDQGFPASGNFAGSAEQRGGLAPTPPAPTYQPGIATVIAARTAEPVSTLLPVQQTPQTSVLATPAVQPAVSYGPEVAFTHRFEHAGLYKIWLEIERERQVLLADFVVRVEE